MISPLTYAPCVCVGARASFVCAAVLKGACAGRNFAEYVTPTEPELLVLHDQTGLLAIHCPTHLRVVFDMEV